MVLLSIFSRIGDWFSDQANAVIFSLAITFIGGILVKHGWTKTIDKVAKKGKVISKKIELGLIEGADVAGALAIMFGKVDDAINDDGTIEQNSVKEAVEAGKEVIVETKDVVFKIKAKPELKAIPPKEPQVKSAQKTENKMPKYKHR